MPHIGNFPGPGYPRPLSIHGAAFLPEADFVNYCFGPKGLQSATSLGMQSFYAPFYLPQGATIKKLTLVGYRDDALANMVATMSRTSDVFVSDTLATVAADWVDGHGSKYDDTIDYGSLTMRLTATLSS